MLFPEVAVLLRRLRRHSASTYQHCYNVSNLCRALGIGLGLHGQEVASIALAGLLHDIGKMRIRPSILHKAARLTPQEWEIMRRHPDFGVEIVSTRARLQVLCPLITYHHERWDGKGYHGLGGEEIPLGARIIALADAFDAMTSSRAYKYSKDLRDGIRELEEGAGTQFDPRLVKVFFEIMPEILKRNSHQAC
ncbi:HD-GYP domain-containing protein [Thermanaeromonas sp. C210]|uniref:HD-GYP domain-containing protein n=1 Tax=Thermanaeromonas sp. C210 TaxID=2731925 RepID=UPI00155CB961|nr:HD-GYP domain-containing protein [Thermanaeromonas sp. C210]GFN22630.1 metal-dependent phosphohydrolase [Thermanaeromonas sp. C210]